MKELDIFQKLQELDFNLSDVLLGDFDAIGEITARKSRDKTHPLYKTSGCFFRPNYERGILAYALVKKYRPKNVLEIGFGRGYWSVCVAKAMYDFDIDGKITTIDRQFDKNHIEKMTKYFPHEWLSKISMIQGNSAEIINSIQDTNTWDLTYIDGDHTYEGVTADWNAVKSRTKLVVFDDYHKPTKKENEIEVAKVVDNLQFKKELIIMDRMIFNDDRGKSIDKDYGQIILTIDEILNSHTEYEYNW